MNLTRLVYYSQSAPSATIDIADLMKTCQQNNAKMNVTGMLQYDGRAFLQVLEGGRAEVSEIYHRIAADPRHTNLILIDCSDVRERMFPTWSLALHEGMDDATKSVFLRYFATPQINPEVVSVESLLDLLQDLSVEQG